MMTMIMTAIQVFFEDYLFAPLEMLRNTHSWWGANFINIIFILICFVAVVYWIGQLKKYDREEGKEDASSSTSHTYL